MTPDGDITIPLKFYNELVRDSQILNALYAGGVDNWDWYYESLKDAGLVDEDDFDNEDDD